MKLILVIIIIAFLVYRNSEGLRRIQKRLNEPRSYDDYLRKLCYLSKKSSYNIFHEASKKYNLPKYLVDRDFDKYLIDESIPDYVKEFIDEGKEIIKNAVVSPFVFYD